MLQPSLINAILVAFVIGFRELAAVALLITANTPLYPTLTFSYWMTGQVGEVAALNIIAVVVPLIFVLLLAKLRRNEFVSLH
jgi:ABC-type Fe3+ transport system permease subunit